MPVSPTYPGVYVQDEPSTRHVVTAAATSTAAFVGRTLFGPVDKPVTIVSWGDFERLFGGLAPDYPLGYAIEQFFANGGSQALVCRLFATDASADGYSRLSLATAAEPLGLVAANPGAWGNALGASIDSDGITAASAAPFAEFGLTQADLFNLQLTFIDALGRVIASERFLQLAVADRAGHRPFPSRIDRVLANQSSLARIEKLSSLPPLVQTIASDGGGNDGGGLTPEIIIGDASQKTGLYLLEKIDNFNLLCIPPDQRIHAGASAGQDIGTAVRQAAAAYCADRRAIFIVDPPADWQMKADAGRIAAIDPATLGISGSDDQGSFVARNAAVYFPRLVAQDRLDSDQPAVFAPCGAVAGVIAATDMARGVWKAPAGTSAAFTGVTGLEARLSDADNGLLNPLGINCLRSFPAIGTVIWGARTLQGADVLADDYKYLPVRRLTLFIEESLLRSTQWAVFEPNAEPLWAALRLQITSFMVGLQNQGAFYNYAVICDASTTSPADIDRGIVNILVQFAPLRPAEFIVLTIQQLAGQSPG